MIVAVFTALRAAILALPAVQTAVGTRVYSLSVPTGAALPYVRLTLNDARDVNRTALEEGDVTVTVLAIGTDAAAVVALADAIRDGLHEATLALAAPYTAFRCQHTVGIAFSDLEDRQVITYAGGDYRVRLSGKQR